MTKDEGADMEFCLTQGCSGPEIGMLIDDLRALGFGIAPGEYFNAQVASALKIFQQSYHDHAGVPLRIDGRLGTSTALALDQARGRGKKHCYFDDDLPPLSEGGSLLARRVALIALAEFMRASGEQGGNNLGADVARYQAGLSPGGTSWSTQFAAWCFQEACDPEISPFGFPQSAQSLINAAWSKDQIEHQLKDGLLPGDLIVWHFEDPSVAKSAQWRGHVGIVWSYEDGNIVTLEGDRGAYPSLVRPFRHKAKNLVQSATDGHFRDGIVIIRV
jgi:CHAP domain